MTASETIRGYLDANEIDYEALSADLLLADAAR